MSTDAMELLIIILAAILGIGVVWEVGKMLIRHFEDRREQDRADHRYQRRLREEVDEDR